MKDIGDAYASKEETYNMDETSTDQINPAKGCGDISVRIPVGEEEHQSVDLYTIGKLWLCLIDDAYTTG